MGTARSFAAVFWALFVLGALHHAAFAEVHNQWFRWKRQSCEGFKCDSGACIDSTLVCDGATDCPDKSDETAKTCSNFANNCPDYSFLCDYGACVDATSRCDGKTDCADSSDEWGCVVGDSKCREDQIACRDGACLSSALLCDGQRDCKDGSDETVGQCSRIRCPKHTFKCTYGACISDLELCDGVYQCADGSDEDEIVCGRVCGSRSSKLTGTTFIVGGQEAKYGEIPWTVAIYEDEGNFMKLICAGTIISRLTVVTAAHCFWDEFLSKPKNMSLYRIAAGKFTSDWNINEKYTQKREIAQLKLYERYLGYDRRQSNDIAVLILKEQLEFTDAVRPACVDWERKLQPGNGVSGLVASWGLNNKMAVPKMLLKAQLTVRDYTTCVNSVPSEFLYYLTDDKFCAGHLNGTGMCNGDSGAGLTFVDPPNAFIATFYLWGIVSVGVVNTQTAECSVKDYSTFTNVYEYIDWIKIYYK